MKHIKFLLFVILCIAFFSCSDDKHERTIVNPITYWRSSIELRVQDAQGTDLLNRQNAGHYRDSEIEVFYNDNIVNAVDVNEYSPETDYYYLQLNLNYPEPNTDKGQHYEEELTTKVTFGSNEPDIIKGLYELKYHEGNDAGFGTGSGYTVILQQAWFNGKEVYEIQAAQSSSWELPIIVVDPNKERE